MKTYLTESKWKAQKAQHLQLQIRDLRTSYQGLQASTLESSSSTLGLLLFGDSEIPNGAAGLSLRLD